MKQNKAEIYRCETDNAGATETSTTKLRLLCEHFRKRKLIWIIFSIIVILLIIIIPTIIITTKKKNVTEGTTEEISMTTMVQTTEKISMTTMVQITERTTVPSTTEVSTKETTIETSTVEITTEVNTIVEGQFLSVFNITNNTKWKQIGSIVAGGNGRGSGLNQMKNCLGIYVDDNDQTIYIVDPLNYRIVGWKPEAKNGEIVAGGNGIINQIDQISVPSDMAFDPTNDSFIICDRGNDRIVRWFRRNRTKLQIIASNCSCWAITMVNNGDIYFSDFTNNAVIRLREGEVIGTIMAGGNGAGNQLNQLNKPAYIFIDEDYSIYISDSDYDRVMKWESYAKQGIIVAGGNGSGSSLTQLSRPQSIIVDHLGNIYVADAGNHRIMRWQKGAKHGSIIVGGNGPGDKLNQLWSPSGLSFDQQGNIYVCSQSTLRVQKFPVRIY